MTELILRAMLAASGVGILAGMLGSFVVWKRMAYMGDAMGHAALLGVVLGLLLGLLPLLAVAAVALAIGFALTLLQRDKRLPFDALLGLISSGGLALGLLLYASQPNRQVDLYGYLFGDVLAVSDGQMLAIYAAILVQGALILSQWRSLLRMIVHEDIARVEGVPVARLQTMMIVLIAVTVALALQVVGMLLVTAMLVIPPLAARLVSRQPAQMMWLSMAAGALSAIGGVMASYHYDLSTGPAIVVAAVVIFAVALVVGRVVNRGY